MRAKEERGKYICWRKVEEKEEKERLKWRKRRRDIILCDRREENV